MRRFFIPPPPPPIRVQVVVDCLRSGIVAAALLCVLVLLLLLPLLPAVQATQGQGFRHSGSTNR